MDDGSRCDVGELCKRFGVNCIRLPTNRGKGFALKEGFKWGIRRDYTIFATVDADGQHKAEHFKDFLKKIRNNDIVIGSRRRRMKDMGFMRILSNRITTTFISIMTGCRLEDSQSGYRVIRRRVLEELELSRNRYDMESELLVKALWKGFRVDFVPISVVRSEKSFINPLRDIFLAITLAIELILERC